MPDSRLSRWKAKLLRRSSSPSAPRADQSVEAVDPKSKSSSSFAPPLFFSDEGDSRGPQSAVSSLFVDYLISDDISGPGTTGSTADQGTIPDRLSAQQGSAEEPRSVDKNVTTDCVRNPLYSGSTPELATSPLQTPITPTTPRTSPLPAPEKPATSALLSTTWNSRGRPAGPALEPQLTPSLNTVVGNPLGNPKRSSLFPPYSTTAPSASPKRPPLASRQQSLLPKSQQHLVSELLDPGHLFREDRAANHSSPTNPEMLHRKIWVKRPGGSATLVPALSDAVVDELRDQVIVKYGNSLGRNFDSPDIAVRIFPREGLNKQTTPERILNPDEPLMSVVDTYYPGGQKAEEALMIDIPQRRTPKPSPRHSVYYHHSEPAEHGDYFTLMPSGANVSTPPAHHSATSSNANSHQGPSISILTTGMAPPLPSPGSRPCRRRPQLTRHTTHSPTVLGQAPTSNEPDVPAGSQPVHPAPAVPTPPAPSAEPPQNKVNTSPARPSSPRPIRKTKKPSEAPSPGAAFGGVVEGTVPPINVLIVEDNIINQKLLEAFLKRLSVRWKCAANGEEALKKWRQGGFHLVLMDIQLPVMNGLDATKEIRRLERLNGIGVFPKTPDGRSSAANVTATSPPERGPEFQLSLKEEDTLGDLSLFKSPVIIVALTASSLQSDRHEALAAGCNDFLTKPIGFPWLEQKVTEWGCMQALIDFEGWRKWRGFADISQLSTSTDPVTSPMRVGQHGHLEKPERDSSSESHSTPRPDGVNESKEGPNPPRPTDAIAREDSSGSGSGSADTLDSPAKY